MPMAVDPLAGATGSAPAGAANGEKGIVVIVEAEVNPTEDEAKVAKAITAMTGSGEFRRVKQGNKLFLVQEGGAQLLGQFRALLRRERILDAARKIMLHNIEGDRIMFWINKQVATVEHISFCRPEGESPLGPISFPILTPDPNSFIEWLATRTVDGIPVDELCQSGARRYAHSGRPTRD